MRVSGNPSARYADEPARVRSHIALRWISCPFAAVLAEIPVGASVLDYGCGHGLLALAAASDRRATVLGVDIDPRKVAVARRAATAATKFALTRQSEIPEGRWDAICVVDVLYLMPPTAQREVLAGLAERLAPGGALIVKEMANRPRAKAAWMRIQERIMVRLIGATSGSTLAFTDVASLEEALRSGGLDVSSRPLRRYPHPHHLLVGRHR